ncbi:MAG: thioredoxin [Victivallales bacterium]|jgi:thioredoxin 1
MGSVKHLNSDNFDSETSKGVALIDFWAEWCGPCKMLGPVLEEVVKEVGNDAVIAKINVDEAQELAMKFAVRSIPAIFILKDGKTVQQLIGVQSKQVLVNAVKEALKA